jgi:hypothetical protein
MAGYLAPNYAEVTDGLLGAVRRSARLGLTIGEIECRHADIDRTLVRTALFALVRHGQLVVPAFDSAGIGSHTVLGVR